MLVVLSQHVQTCQMLCTSPARLRFIIVIEKCPPITHICSYQSYRTPDGSFDADCAAPMANCYSIPDRLILLVLASCTSPVALPLPLDVPFWVLALVASGTMALCASPSNAVFTIPIPYPARNTACSGMWLAQPVARRRRTHI